MALSGPLLGELLVRMSLITQRQLDEALKVQRQLGGKLGEVLVTMGILAEDDILEALSKKFNIPLIDLESTEIEESVVKIIPSHYARRYHIMPVMKKRTTLTIAMADPTSINTISDIKFFTGYHVEPVIARESAITSAIERYYGGAQTGLRKVIEDMGVIQEASSLQVLEDEDKMDVATLEADAKQPPVVNIVNLMIAEAARKNASDIHIEPYETEFRVRMRVDGVLYDIIKLPMKYKEAVVSRIKVLSRLDIAEKRLPQDGRIKIQMKLDNISKTIDLRVSILPTLFGEKVVMRLLDKDNLMLDMHRLGFEPEGLVRFEEAIFKPWGMVLVTGPTGSGKTSTLYSAINRINTPEVNIITAEDPIEFNLQGINQVQMHDTIGLTFASALRSFLRQDPNIILVGEIRDMETAEIAVKASLTGHLVLSTLHTNDAPSAVTRLVNMGIEPLLVTSSVILIAGQRLVRRICQECKEEVEIPRKALLNIGFVPEEAECVKAYTGRGCEKCGHTGYKGRIGLYEVMPLTDSLRQIILEGCTLADLKKAAIEEGMITLRQSGLIKIKAGITTMEEVIRETVL
ncbi:MAG TPA: type IV-A pilus assembly ATPase PilB [Syntrophorhabdales bacterium]|nr:type IV-A pilus assembly ATPase PilB [Syntrophorhabdales bacterium]